VITLNRSQLRKRLEELGIPGDTLVLEGEPYSEEPTSHPREYGGIRVLKSVEGGWAIFRSERGNVFDEAFFDNEDDACQEILLRMTVAHSILDEAQREAPA